MEKHNIEENKKRSNIIRILLTIILTLIGIFLIFSIYWIVNKRYNKSESEKLMENKIEIIKQRFWLKWEYTKLHQNEYTFYSKDDKRTILLHPTESTFWVWEPKWKDQFLSWIRFSDFQDTAVLTKYYNDNWEWNRYYRFLLVRQNPEWWEFITNPENYKIQNIFFSNQYYKDFAQKSWDNLVWPNWAYYSWEYDENLNRNWYWEMHYFWTETANNFKIDWTDIILEFDESISLYNGNRIYFWKFKNWKKIWEGEDYRYYMSWNRVVYLSWDLNEEWEYVGTYDRYVYNKINKKWWSLREDPKSYRIEEEWHINQTEWTQEYTQKDINWKTFKTIYNWEKTKDIYLEWWYELFSYYWWYKNYLDTINSYDPKIEWNMLIWDNIELLEWKYISAKYEWNYKEDNWKIIKSWKWILKISDVEEYYLSWTWDNDRFINWTEHYHYKDYNFTYTWDFNNSTFMWEGIKSDFWYYRWYMNKYNNTLIKNWIYKNRRWDYYSGWFNDLWEKEWYWILRLYIPKDPKDWSYPYDEDKYEIVYELSWFWENDNYIWKYSS